MTSPSSSEVKAAALADWLPKEGQTVPYAEERIPLHLNQYIEAKVISNATWRLDLCTWICDVELAPFQGLANATDEPYLQRIYWNGTLNRWESNNMLTDLEDAE